MGVVLAMLETFSNCRARRHRQGARAWDQAGAPAGVGACTVAGQAWGLYTTKNIGQDAGSDSKVARLTQNDRSWR